MNCKPVREEQDSRGLTAGASCVTPAKLDKTVALFELQKKRREEEELKALCQERKQVLENLDKRIEELRKDYQHAHDLSLSFDLFLKDEDASRAAEKAERESQEVLQKEEELERLKEKYAQLVKRKQELEVQVQRHFVSCDFMEQVLKLTTFEDVESLTGHLESLLHFRDRLCKRYNEAQKQADQQQKLLVSLKDQHHLMQLENYNQFSKLQSELDETLSEVLIWERTWDQIRQKAAKKTLLLGQIKMTVLNLYEMAGGKFEEEDISMSDTEQQLDSIKLSIQEHENILKMYQTTPEKDNDEQKERESQEILQKEEEQKIDRAKEPIGTHQKNHSDIDVL